MANEFKIFTSRDIGQTEVIAGNYTAGSGVTAILIGLSLANTSSSTITVSVRLFDGTNYTHLVKGAPVPVGSSLVPVGGDQKLVLKAGYRIMVKSSANTSLDVVLSVLEQ